MQIGVAQDGVVDKRDAAYYGVDCLGAFKRVALVAQQEVGLELYEVGLMLLDVLAKVGSRMFS